jgi:hypothetical protein
MKCASVLVSDLLGSSSDFLFHDRWAGRRLCFASFRFVWEIFLIGWLFSTQLSLWQPCLTARLRNLNNVSWKNSELWAVSWEQWAVRSELIFEILPQPLFDSSSGTVQDLWKIVDCARNLSRAWLSILKHTFKGGLVLQHQWNKDTNFLGPFRIYLHRLSRIFSLRFQFRWRRFGLSRN